MKTEIIYEDGELLVIWKPAGLAAQTARAGQADVVSELKNYLAKRAPGKGAPYLGIIHRLDQPVEGLLVFAKNRTSAAALTAQLGGGHSGLMNKQYYAVICGKPAAEEGHLVDYMRRGADGRAEIAGREFPHREETIHEQTGVCRGAGRKAVSADGEWKRAVLNYRILQSATVFSGDVLSLADICIGTGRFHQIRAQMANAGMALLGDAKYGDERAEAAAKRLDVRTAALCAYRLDFVHPVTGKRLRFERMPQSRAFSFFAFHEDTNMIR